MSAEDREELSQGLTLPEDILNDILKDESGYDDLKRLKRELE